MVKEFIIDIDIEINKYNTKSDFDELKNEMELLECNPSLVTLFCEIGEIDRRNNLIFYEEDLDCDEDYSNDVEPILDLLLRKYGNLIEEGSKFKFINRNSISSITWTMEDSKWEVYQDINRDYGYGSFEDDLEDNNYSDSW